MTQYYELTLKGFDGGTDKTDHLILWVPSELSAATLWDWIFTTRLPVRSVHRLDFEPNEPDPPAPAQELFDLILNLTKDLL